MPEGDTVWRAARQLHEVLANQVLVISDFRVPAYSTIDLTGCLVREVVARGKRSPCPTTRANSTRSRREARPVFQRIISGDPAVPAFLSPPF
jgi:endonuclease VIII